MKKRIVKRKPFVDMKARAAIAVILLAMESMGITAKQ